MFLSEAIEDFARYSLGVKGYAKKTHITYQNRQRQFADWLAERKNLPDIQVHDITPELLREFVYHLSGPQGRRDVRLRPVVVAPRLPACAPARFAPS